MGFPSWISVWFLPSVPAQWLCPASQHEDESTIIWNNWMYSIFNQKKTWLCIPDGWTCWMWNLFPSLLQEWFKTAPRHGDGDQYWKSGLFMPGCCFAASWQGWKHPWIPLKTWECHGAGPGLPACRCKSRNSRGNAKVLPTLLPQPTFILAWNVRNNLLLGKYGGQFIKNSFPLTLVIKVALFFLPASREGNRQPKLCWMKDKWVIKLLENL